MFCSQVGSKHSSPCFLAVEHHHKAWGLKNAEMRLSEAETCQRDCKGNPESGDNCSKSIVNASSVYGGSSIKSSWIQRLIPAQVTGANQSSLTKALPNKDEKLHGQQVDWNNDALLKSNGGNELGIAVHKNSRRSEQVFPSRHEILPSRNRACSGHIDCSACVPMDALHTRIQVPPRTLPVVESLLNTGCSNNSVMREVSLERNKYHNLLKGSHLPIKQIIHFSANERSRISCSSIEEAKQHFSICSAGNFKSLLKSDKRTNASSPKGKFLFKHPKGPLRSHIEPICRDVQPKTCTYLAANLKDGQEAGQSNCSERRDAVSCRGLPPDGISYGAVKNTFKDESIMPCSRIKASTSKGHTLSAREAEGLHLDKECVQTTVDRSHEISQKDWDYRKGADFAFEVFCGKRGAENTKPGFGGHGHQHFSSIISTQVDGLVREKTSISLAPGFVEQDLETSRDSHKEKNVSSGSFSFGSKGISHGSVNVAERGHWPFCQTSPYDYMDYLDQPEEPKDLKTKGLVEASLLGIPLHDVSSMQQQINNAHRRKKYPSPFFGTAPLMEYGEHRHASHQNDSSYKPKCVLKKDPYIGEPEVEAVYSNEIIPDARAMEDAQITHNAYIIASRLNSALATEGVKSREDPCHYSSGTMNRIIFEGVKPHFNLSSLSVGSTESTSKRPACLGNHDVADKIDTADVFTVVDEPMTVPSALAEKHSRNSGFGSHSNKDLDGLLLRREMWFKRWSKRRPHKQHSVPRSKGIQGFVNSRCFTGSSSSLQSSWDSSHFCDLRPAKRACHGQRIGARLEQCQAIPALGSIALGTENQQASGFTSHFIKRFLTPSAAALAVLGMTARTAHASQPHRKALFGLWPEISSTNRSFKGEVDVTGEFMTRQEDKKEFFHSSAKRSSAQLDA